PAAPEYHARAPDDGADPDLPGAEGGAGSGLGGHRRARAIVSLLQPTRGRATTDQGSGYQPAVRFAGAAGRPRREGDSPPAERHRGGPTTTAYPTLPGPTRKTRATQRWGQGRPPRAPTRSEAAE